MLCLFPYSAMSIRNTRTAIIDVSALPVILRFNDYKIQILEIQHKISSTTIAEIPKDVDLKKLFVTHSDFHCNYAAGEGACTVVMKDWIKDAQKKNMPYILKSESGKVPGFSCVTGAQHCFFLTLQKPVDHTYEISEITNYNCRLKILLAGATTYITFGEHLEFGDFHLNIRGACPPPHRKLISDRSNDRINYYSETGFQAEESLRRSAVYYASGWKLHESAFTIRLQPSGAQWDYSVLDSIAAPTGPIISDAEPNIDVSYIFVTVDATVSIKDLTPVSSNDPRCEGSVTINTAIPVTSFHGFYLELHINKVVNCRKTYKTGVSTLEASFIGGKALIPYSRTIESSGFKWKDKVVRQSSLSFVDLYENHVATPTGGVQSFLDSVGNNMKKFGENVTHFFSNMLNSAEKWIIYIVIFFVVISFPGLALSKFGIVLITSAVIYVQMHFASAAVPIQTLILTVEITDKAILTALPFQDPPLEIFFLHILSAIIQRQYNKKHHIFFVIRFIMLFCSTYMAIGLMILYHFLNLSDFNRIHNVFQSVIQEVELKSSVVLVNRGTLSERLNFYRNRVSKSFRSVVCLKSINVFYSDRKPMRESVLAALRNFSFKHKYTHMKLKSNVRLMEGLFFFPQEFVFIKKALSKLSEKQIQEFYTAKITIAERSPFDISPFFVRINPHTMKHIIKDFPIKQQI